MKRRLDRRTEMVAAAWPDVAALAAARDALLALEKDEVLFAGVKVCPFAGYVEDNDDGGRVGCLLHPTRHPTGADLRDLAVYPKEVCAGHFCAPHDWLREREALLAQTARGARYGLIVTDAGLVKGVCALLDDRLARRFTVDDIPRAAAPLDVLWNLCWDWPWRDPDPRRFGGFLFSGDEASERTLPSCLFGFTAADGVLASPALQNVLDGLGTKLDDAAVARACIARLSAALDEVAVAMERA